MQGLYSDATKINSASRGLCDALSLCDEDIEDEAHVFLNCVAVCARLLQADNNNLLTLQILYSMFAGMLRGTKLGVLLFLCGVFGKTATIGFGMVISAMLFSWDNKLMLCGKSGLLKNNRMYCNVSHQMQEGESWIKPSQGWIKCNIDAGFHSAQGITSWACCARDYEGIFIQAQTGWKQAAMTMIVTEGEGMTLLEGIYVAINNGWECVVFETDSQLLVDHSC
ncbi:cytochrome p450 [Trifolium pratense]|uniref:Cytochrome p450 n=1 Tax=Trifolium pratense TaxID=57577 RepID=A0A2K3KI67_TRIPR|nr:cytochrome p450 [Trifolium pratense]